MTTTLPCRNPGQIQTDSVRRRRRIAFLGFDGVKTLDLTAQLEAFVAARSRLAGEAAARQYEIVLLGASGRTFVSQSGVIFKAQETLLSARDFDTIIIPGGNWTRARPVADELMRWLVRQVPRTRRVAAVCGGIYPLAQTGLLDGRQVTTHWRMVADVARRFPRVRVRTDVSFLEDGPFHTCGGGTASMEMTLALIQQDEGVQLAQELARELVLPLRPPGVAEVVPDASMFETAPTDRVAELSAWIANNLHRKLSVETLAERACVCPRHFYRLFKLVYGCPPAEYVQRLRLNEARRRLQTSRNSVRSIASAVGFNSAEAFRRAFQQQLGLRPSACRNGHLRTA
jgi:transcriptional regulator GlxA family with amidase domain